MCCFSFEFRNAASEILLLSKNSRVRIMPYKIKIIFQQIFIDHLLIARYCWTLQMYMTESQPSRSNEKNTYK